MTNATAASVADDQPKTTIGSILRELRKKQKLSVNGLALKAGVSAGMVSQIERNIANPSIKILDKLGLALNVPLSAFLELEDLSPSGGSSGGSIDRSFRPHAEHIIRRQADRPKFTVGRSPLYKELLSPSGAEDMQFMIIKMPPHARNEDVVVGPGQKAGLVMAGEMTLTVEDRETIVYAGDSFQFEGNRPHGIRNDTASETTVLWIMTSVRPIHM